MRIGRAQHFVIVKGANGYESGKGYSAHHLVNQTAANFDNGQTLGEYISQQAFERGYGDIEVTPEIIESFIHHPLNLAVIEDADHKEIHRVYNGYDHDNMRSHVYQHQREQSYDDQMLFALKTMKGKARDAYDRYIERMAFFRK